MKLTKEMLTEMVKEVIQEQMEEVAGPGSMMDKIRRLADYLYTVSTGDMSARNALKRMKEEGLLEKEIQNKFAELSNKVFGDRSAESSPMLDLQDIALEETKRSQILKKHLNRMQKLIG